MNSSNVPAQKSLTTQRVITSPYLPQVSYPGMTESSVSGPPVMHQYFSNIPFLPYPNLMNHPSSSSSSFIYSAPSQPFLLSQSSSQSLSHLKRTHFDLNTDCDKENKEEGMQEKKRKIDDKVEALSKDDIVFKVNIEKSQNERKNETSKEVNNLQRKMNIPQMRFLMGHVEQVVEWCQKNRSILSAKIIIQMIGVFVKVLKANGSEFLLLVRGIKPNSPHVQVVYYSIDRPLPVFLPNQTIICAGHMKKVRKMQAFDFVKFAPDLMKNFLRITQFCSKVIQDV